MNNKMNLLHIVPTYYPAIQYGGVITVSHEINKQLVKRGIDVTVFTTTDGQGDKVRPNIFHNLDGVKVIYLKSYFETGYGISWRLPFYLFREIKKFDVVHHISVFTFTSFFTPLICLMRSKPYINASHGTLDPQMMSQKSGFIKNLALNLYERFFLNKANAIHVLVEDEASWLKQLGIHNRNVVKIPNGMDCPPAANINKSHEANKIINLLYLGRLNYKKNIDLIIYAYKELRSKYTNIRLVIAGSDDGSEIELKKIAKEIGIENQLSFVGLVKGAEKERLLQECDIFLLPSKNEGLSMAQLEAMCAECAVIVGNRGGIHNELKKYNAGIVIVPSVENIILAIEHFVENPDKMLQVGRNARKLVLNDYSNEKILDSYIDLYEKLNMKVRSK